MGPGSHERRSTSRAALGSPSLPGRARPGEGGVGQGRRPRRCWPWPRRWPCTCGHDLCRAASCLPASPGRHATPGRNRAGFRAPRTERPGRRGSACRARRSPAASAGTAPGAGFQPIGYSTGSAIWASDTGGSRKARSIGPCLPWPRGSRRRWDRRRRGSPACRSGSRAPRPSCRRRPRAGSAPVGTPAGRRGRGSVRTGSDPERRHPR